jgi:hypothetical protein
MIILMIQNNYFYRSFKYLPAVLAALGIADISAAADKSRYTLWDPTPPSLMRELSTDRPDTTESPYTLDAGHFQVEMSFLEYTRDSANDTYSIFPSNFKLGLLNSVDLQIIINPYRLHRERVSGAKQQRSGFGDMEVRTKFNLWGNDEGVFALAAMPFVRLPTGTDGSSTEHFEGGLILPMGFSLPEDFYLGAMLEFDFNRDAANAGYGCEIVHTITLSRPLWDERLSMFVEYAGFAPIDLGSTYRAYFNAGFTFGLTENIQLDAGVNIGLSESADDITLFAGLTYRK